MTIAELEVWGVEEEKKHPCIMVTKETSNETDFFICEIQRTANANFQQLMVNLSFKLHQFTVVIVDRIKVGHSTRLQYITAKSSEVY